MVAFLPHLNKSQCAEHDLDVAAKTKATPLKKRIHFSCNVADSLLTNRATVNACYKLFLS